MPSCSIHIGSLIESRGLILSINPCSWQLPGYRPLTIKRWESIFIAIVIGMNLVQNSILRVLLGTYKRIPHCPNMRLLVISSNNTGFEMSAREKLSVHKHTLS